MAHTKMPVFKAACGDGWEQLTSRELELLDLLLDDAPANSEIGRQLAISEETVKRHLSNIMNKVGCDTRTELVMWTLRRQERERVRLGIAEVADPLRAKIVDLEVALEVASSHARLIERCFRHGSCRASAREQYRTGL